MQGRGRKTPCRSQPQGRSSPAAPAAQPARPLGASARTSGWWTSSTSSTSPTRTASTRRGGTSSRTTGRSSPARPPPTAAAPRPRPRPPPRQRPPPTPPRAPAPTAPVADGTPAAQQVAQKPADAPVSPPAEAKNATPAPTAPAVAAGDDVRTLKGPAARVVSNMNASLAVPTATSVRAVPAKLLIDNRIVINNHLQRNRGGKVSFTHLIGFAVVKALAEMPEMNHGFTEVDGKPAVVTPRARELRPRDRRPEARRQPHAARAVHQGRRHDGLRRLLVGVRGHRPPRPQQQADRRRLRRDDDHPHQPGHHRHRPLGAAADGRPGHDHRRRRDGVPRRVPGRGPRDAGPAGGQQDHDADVDVRPPDHPGRAVRRLPAPDARAAARRAELLRRDLPLAAHPVRADPLGPRHLGLARGRRRQAGPGPGADPRLPRARPPDGRHRPAGVPPAQPPRPRRRHPRPDPVGPRPRVRHRRLRRQADGQPARDPRRAARLVLPPHRHRVHAHPGPRRAALDPGAGRGRLPQAGPPGAAARSCAGSTRPRRSRPSCRPSTSGRSGSRSRAASRSSRCSTRS